MIIGLRFLYCLKTISYYLIKGRNRMNKGSLKLKLSIVCLAAVLIISVISNRITAQEVEQSSQPAETPILRTAEITPNSQPTEITEVAPRPKPAKIANLTPSDVFGTIDLLNRTVNVMLKARQTKLPQPPDSLETGLGPMHVYQLLVACTKRLREFDFQINTRPIPLVIVSPMKYTPMDVKILADMILSDIQIDAAFLKIDGLPDEETLFSNKTPTDVFQEVLRLFVNLGALSGQQKIDPNKVFAEMVRGVKDVKSILSNIDFACRYKIDVPISKPNLTPANVFTGCIETRRMINRIRIDYNMGVVPIPKISKSRRLQPSDVFVQTQIIIAEINLLKMASNTIGATPLAIPVTGKKPSDVHQQAVMIQYLLNQIETVKKEAKKI